MIYGNLIINFLILVNSQAFQEHNVSPFRLIFTSDRVVVGVVIRIVEWYDLVKIKLTESEAKHPFCLWLDSLQSSENCGSGRINQSSASASDSNKLVFTWTESGEMKTFRFFRLCFRRAHDSAYDSNSRFSLGPKRSYDSDSVASKNHPLGVSDTTLKIFSVFFLLLPYSVHDLFFNEIMCLLLCL